MDRHRHQPGYNHHHHHHDGGQFDDAAVDYEMQLAIVAQAQAANAQALAALTASTNALMSSVEHVTVGASPTMAAAAAGSLADRGFDRPTLTSGARSSLMGLTEAAAAMGPYSWIMSGNDDSSAVADYSARSRQQQQQRQQPLREEMETDDRSNDRATTTKKIAAHGMAVGNGDAGHLEAETETLIAPVVGGGGGGVGVTAVGHERSADGERADARKLDGAATDVPGASAGVIASASAATANTEESSGSAQRRPANGGEPQAQGEGPRKDGTSTAPIDIDGEDDDSSVAAEDGVGPTEGGEGSDASTDEDEHDDDDDDDDGYYGGGGGGEVAAVVHVFLFGESGALGLTVEEDAEHRCFVDSIKPGGQAETLGLRPGDCVVSAARVHPNEAAAGGGAGHRRELGHREASAWRTWMRFEDFIAVARGGHRPVRVTVMREAGGGDTGGTGGGRTYRHLVPAAVREYAEYVAEHASSSSSDEDDDSPSLSSSSSPSSAASSSSSRSEEEEDDGDHHDGGGATADVYRDVAAAAMQEYASRETATPSSRDADASSSSSLSVSPSPTWRCASTPLSMPDDRNFIPELQCYLRSDVLEAFGATRDDVDSFAARSLTSRRRPTVVGHVGVRCKFCHGENWKEGDGDGAVFAASIDALVRQVFARLFHHVHVCEAVPPEVRGDLTGYIAETVASPGRAGGNKSACIRYWVESAKRLGLTEGGFGSGIWFDRDPEVCRREAREALESTREELEEEGSSLQLVFSRDRPLIAEEVYIAIQQMYWTTLREADRRGCFRHLGVGFPGLACRHCVGRQNLNNRGRWFPPSEKSMQQTSTAYLIIHHLRNCDHCPREIKEKLATLQEQRGRYKKSGRPLHGGRKIFWHRLWCRMHRLEHEDEDDGAEEQEQEAESSDDSDASEDEWDEEDLFVSPYSDIVDAVQAAFVALIRKEQAESQEKSGSVMAAGEPADIGMNLDDVDEGDATTHRTRGDVGLPSSTASAPPDVPDMDEPHLDTPGIQQSDNVLTCCDKNKGENVSMNGDGDADSKERKGLPARLRRSDVSSLTSAELHTVLKKVNHVHRPSDRKRRLSEVNSLFVDKPDGFELILDSGSHGRSNVPTADKKDGAAFGGTAKVLLDQPDDTGLRTKPATDEPSATKETNSSLTGENQSCGKGHNSDQINLRAGSSSKVVSSEVASGCPDGWVKRMHKTPSGRRYPLYSHFETGKTCRSLAEVQRYLRATTEKPQQPVQHDGDRRPNKRAKSTSIEREEETPRKKVAMSVSPRKQAAKSVKSVSPRKQATKSVMSVSPRKQAAKSVRSVSPRKQPATSVSPRKKAAKSVMSVSPRRQQGTSVSPRKQAAKPVKPVSPRKPAAKSVKSVSPRKQVAKSVSVGAKKRSEQFENSAPPRGWRIETIARKSGTKASYKHYYSPKTNRMFRSLAAVRRFLAALEATNNDEDKAWALISGK